MKRISHENFLKAAMAKPGVIKELKNIDDEFKIYEELIKARLKSGKTQDDNFLKKVNAGEWAAVEVFYILEFYNQYEGCYFK